MPVAQGLRLGAVRGIVIGLAGLGAGVGAMLLMLWLAGTSDKIEVYLGDDDFRGIHAASLAAGIARPRPGPPGGRLDTLLSIQMKTATSACSRKCWVCKTMFSRQVL